MSQYNKIMHIPYIKPGGGNPIGGKRSQMQAKESALILTVVSISKIPSSSVIYAEDISQTHSGSLIAS